MRTMRLIRCFVGPHRFVYVLCYASWLSKMPHFGGCTAQWGLWPPNSNLAETFVQCTYPQVSSSYVYSFGSYRVNTQTYKSTNEQTLLKTSNVLRYATTLGKYVNNETVCPRESIKPLNVIINGKMSRQGVSRERNVQLPHSHIQH